MTLPVSGAISLGAVNVELQRSATATISMNDSELRTLFATPSGAIGLATGYGKANKFLITIPSNQTNFDLRSYLVANGWNQSSRAEVTINSGVLIYATTTANKGLTVSGSFPNGVQIINNGTIAGHSGNGGGGNNTAGGAGTSGGTALYTTVPLIVTNNGAIRGGGGGGGGGGGVQRYNPGFSNPKGFQQVSGGAGGKGQNATSGNAGGAGGATKVFTSEYGTYLGRITGGRGGTGGNWGAAGNNGAGGAVTGNWGAGSVHGGGGGGAAGKSVEGTSNITWVVTGTINGSQT